MNIITTEEQLKEFVDFYSKVDAFAFDTETIGETRIQPVLNKVAWISFATEGRTDVIPMGHPNGEFQFHTKPLLKAGQQRVSKGKPLTDAHFSKNKAHWVPQFGEPPAQLMPAQVFAAIKPLMFSDKLKIGHNLKFDLKSITKYYRGQVPSKPYFDTLMAAFIVNNTNKFDLGLQSCVKRELGIDIEKGVGEDISQHSFEDVAKYSAIDAEVTWKLYKALAPKIDSSLERVWKLEMDVLRALCDMELTGALIDEHQLEVLAEQISTDLEAAKGKAFKAAGEAFAINSVQVKQKLLFAPGANGKTRIKPNIKYKNATTPKGKEALSAGKELNHSMFSVSSDALEIYRGKDELVDALLEYQDLNKLMTTYVTPYKGGEVERETNGKKKTINKASLLINGRVHTNFKAHGAETGRFSCVSGDTLLPTNRGVFRFDEYVPQAGDMVMTHALRWMPVLKKIYKGKAEMFRVTLENGSVLHCTMDHKLLTMSGWQPLRNLTLGTEVASYGNIEILCNQLGESQESSSRVQLSSQTNARPSGKDSWNNDSERSSNSQGQLFSGETEGRKKSQVLSVKSWEQEPYEGQVWLPTPQLRGSDFRRKWVPTGESEWEVHSFAPSSNGTSIGSGKTTKPSRRSSHRPRQAQQQPGQSSVGYESRARENSRSKSRIKEIQPMGTLGVWDISVAGDESYLAQGFINHNSSEPNLQNIPSSGEYGKLIRNLFIAPPGHKLVVADYSQIEPRVIASLSQDPVLINNYMTGGDIYTTIGDTMGVDRKAGKVLVLAISYGVGPDKIADSIGCSVKEAKDLLTNFEKKFPSINRYKAQVVRLAKQKSPVPFVETIFGRRRYIPDLRSRETGLLARAERQAFNTVIQGSAADIMKLALIRAHSCFVSEPDVNLILTVHDELVTVAPDDKAEETAEAIRESMEGIKVKSITVPLIADIQIVDKWGEAK